MCCMVLKITITNNDGKDTYVFKENGEFTFEFIDENGNKGSALASVNWIDKIPPTATITYDITEETDKSVTATLSGFSEKVTIVNNSGSDKYVFNDNGEFTFEFVDEAGNSGKATATVNWINKKSDEQNPDDENKPEEGQNPDGDDKPEEGQEPDGEDEPEEGQKPDGENKPEEEKPDDEDELKEEENNKLNDIEKDDTVANGKIPQTGTNNLVIYILLGITIIAIIFYIKMKK